MKDSEDIGCSVRRVVRTFQLYISDVFKTQVSELVAM